MGYYSSNVTIYIPNAMSVVRIALATIKFLLSNPEKHFLIHSYGLNRNRLRYMVENMNF